jgi:hypothetical protein
LYLELKEEKSPDLESKNTIRVCETVSILRIANFLQSLQNSRDILSQTIFSQKDKTVWQKLWRRRNE